MLAGYERLMRAAARLQWDEAGLDLAPDAAAWPRLPAAQREVLARLVAGFCLAETAVAEWIAPYGAAAADPRARRCFAAQRIDEERHARFFARVAGEVLGLRDADALRAAAGPGIVELFERRLPDVAGRLGAGEIGLDEAVALYHVVLEGIVFSVGQEALIAALERAGCLPGVLDGVERVYRDERWHVALGLRVLLDAGTSTAGLAGLVDDARAAAGAWGAGAVDPGLADAVVGQHRRRIGLLDRYGRAAAPA
jgi:ribonucleoside-diphosphate reductase beta chain